MKTPKKVRFTPLVQKNTQSVSNLFSRLPWGMWARVLINVSKTLGRGMATKDPYDCLIGENIREHFMQGGFEP